MTIRELTPNTVYDCRDGMPRKLLRVKNADAIYRRTKEMTTRRMGVAEFAELATAEKSRTNNVIVR